MLNLVARRCSRSWWQSCLRARRCSCSACRGELPGALLSLPVPRKQSPTHFLDRQCTIALQQLRLYSGTAVSRCCILVQELQARCCRW